MTEFDDLKIFKLNRIRYQELIDDAITYVKKTYNASKQSFTMASPFAQLLSVMMHLGRMILYYIEDSVTSLNIRTATRPDSIKGLAQLTGHQSSRAMSARAAARISFVNKGNMDLTGKVAYIPNKTSIQSTINGLSYIMLFGSDTARMTMDAGNFIDCTIIQGVMKYQRATATGEPLQSFNFSERNFREIEQYFINVYVNNEPWTIVSSLHDLSYGQKGVVVRTGITSGIDVFFGNGDYGLIPSQGSLILVEYVVSDGIGGNLDKDYVNNTSDAWKFNTGAFLEDGSQIQLNGNFSLKLNTDIIFGSGSEDITLTQLLAPHASRAMVLANETNYRYFLMRTGEFSTVEVVKGYASQDANAQAQVSYNSAQSAYYAAYDEWKTAVSQYGETSPEAQQKSENVQQKLQSLQVARQRVDDTDMPDNTVYLMLIPDIRKRIPSSDNYFSCSESLFTLTDDEQYNILEMIENSGQKIITMENRILSPKTPRFAINADVKLWEGYNVQSVYTSCLKAISDYLLNMTRKDMIPLSDLTAALEGIDGIDSVKVWFDADKNNQELYAKDGFYGIDDFGDVVLTRSYTSQGGNVRTVRDILPLFRGGFMSPDGVEYSDVQSYDSNSAFNMNVVSYTKRSRLATDTPIN